MHCVDVAYKPLYRLENLDFARNRVIDRGVNKVFFSVKHTDYNYISQFYVTYYGWLGSQVVACWTQVQKGLGSNCSRDTVG